MKMEMIVIFLGLVLFLCLFSTMSFATVDEKNVTVNISIGAVAEITVIPSAINWTDVNPGHTGGVQYLDVKNTGSLNVSEIYAFVDTLTDEVNRPYDSDNASDYAAGGIITLLNQSGYDSGADYYFFAGRIEWNWTDDVSNKNMSNFDSPVAWGFYRNTSYEFFWGVGNGTGSLCNNSGTQFGIDDDIDVGTEDTRTPEITDISYDGGDADYGYFSISRANSPLNKYCVAVSTDCTKTYIYKYDKRSGFDTCSNAEYLRVNNLQPGKVERIRIDVYLPYGTPNGIMNQSSLTFHATG